MTLLSFSMVLPTVTKIFQMLLMQRFSWCLLYPIKNINHAIPLVWNMTYEIDYTSGIFIVNSEGYLCGALMPSPHTNDDLTIGHVEVNMNNEPFESAKLPVKVLQHVIAMVPMGSIPR